MSGSLTTVDDCRIIELPQIQRPEGSITVVEAFDRVPFELARVYYLYDIPGGQCRGGHAHRQLQQLIVACLGAFDVILDDGRQQRTVNLNRSYYGLYLPPGIWRELVNFSSGAVCLVLASRKYEESDYIRDHDEFVRVKPGLQWDSARFQSA
ncbi:MAG: FdtA/QdtA family cupin domain-containing protein [Acidobacteriota bacterium]